MTASNSFPGSSFTIRRQLSSVKSQSAFSKPWRSRYSIIDAGSVHSFHSRSVIDAPPSTVLCSKILHEPHECRDSFARHGVVDRGANAADAAVAGQAVELELGGVRHELLLELFARQAEGRVHERAVRLLGVAAIEA